MDISFRADNYREEIKQAKRAEGYRIEKGKEMEMNIYFHAPRFTGVVMQNEAKKVFEAARGILFHLDDLTSWSFRWSEDNTKSFIEIEIYSLED